MLDSYPSKPVVRLFEISKVMVEALRPMFGMPPLQGESRMFGSLDPDMNAERRWRAAARFRCELPPIRNIAQGNARITRVPMGVFTQPAHPPRIFRELDERYTDEKQCPEFIEWLRDILQVARQAHEKAQKILADEEVLIDAVYHPVCMQVLADRPYILPEGIANDKDPDELLPSAHDDNCNWGIVTNTVFERTNLTPESAESRSYFPDKEKPNGRREIFRRVLGVGEGVYQFDVDEKGHPILLHGVTPAVLLSGKTIGWRAGGGWDFKRIL